MERAHRVAAFWLSLAFFVLYASLNRGHFISTDEVLVYQATKSLWEERDLSIDARDSGQSLPGRDGKRFAQYNSGQSLAALPLFALGRAAGSISHAIGRPELVALFAGRDISRPGLRWGGEIEIFFVILLNAAFVAALCGAFFLLSLQTGATDRSSLLAALLLGLSYVGGFSTGFYQHPSEMFFLLVAFSLLFRDSRRPDWRLRALAGAAVALMLQFRFPSVFSLPALFLYLLLVILRRTPRNRRIREVLVQGLPFAAAVGAGMGLHYIDEWVKFGGTFVNAGYASVGFHTPLLTGLFGLLLSPGLGLLWFIPALFLVPAALYSFRRDWPLETVYIVATFISYAIIIGKYGIWSGMYCFGPRYLTVTVPILFIPLALWLDRSAPAARIAAGTLGVLSAIVFVLHVTVDFWSALVYERLIEYRPEYQFLFIPELSPLAAHARALLEGDERVDFWLINTARSFGGGTTAFIALAALCLITACASNVVRALRGEQAVDEDLFVGPRSWSAALAATGVVILIATVTTATPVPPPSAASIVGAATASGVDVQAALMERALDLLYRQRRPDQAAVLFEQVLQINPQHYGATYQLATALDLLGKRSEAEELWRRVLAMAKAYSDASTLERARARLAD